MNFLILMMINQSSQRIAQVIILLVRCLYIKIYKNYYLERLHLIMIFVKLGKIQDDVKDNDDFNNGEIYKIYKDINEVLYIGFTCSLLLTNNPNPKP
jgi:hypothetical protein